MNKQDTITRLLLDESFREWVLAGGEENSGFGQRWMRMHAEQADILREARDILLELRADKARLPKERKDMLRQRIRSFARSDQSPSAYSAYSWKRRNLVKTWIAVAAVVWAVVTLCALLYQSDWNQPNEMRYATAYGEIKTITLPDSSRVTLNGNSSIRYFHRKNKAFPPREVWLEGEGFFEVSKRQIPSDHGDLQPVRFIVHTENLSVQVLGTRFNVRHRRTQTQVVLEEGSIQLDLKEQANPLLMSPDELVEINKGEKQIRQQVVKANDYIAWKEGWLHFDGASFLEISRILEDNYNLELAFANKQQSEDINLRGSFPADNIDILLEAIANVTHTTISKKGKTIIYQ